MAIKGLTSHYNDYPVRLHGLTEAECETIINAGFEVAEKIGIKCSHQKSVDIMVKAGCRYEDGIVYIPRELVIDAINSIPNHVDIYNRQGELAMHLGGNCAYYGTGPTNPFVNDFETGERRLTVIQDVANESLVCDACENISFVYNLADPSDVPKAINDVYSMKEMILNTSKPIVCLAVDQYSLAEQFEMVMALYDGDWDAYRAKPSIFCMPLSPISPLCMPLDNDMEKMWFCCERDIPMIFANALQPGMTAPVTLAGAMAVSLAEQYFGMVLSQLINKGCRYIGHHMFYTVDMSTMNPCYGTPEHCLGDMAGADIFRYFDIPLHSTAAASEAKIVDAQWSMEAAMTVLSTTLCGAQMIHDTGFMDSALTTSLDALTFTSEIVGFAKHINKGFEVSEDTLALDVIAEVGHGGNYMTEDHTLEYYRDITWLPKLVDRTNYATWTANGSKDMSTRVHERTKWILENYKPAGVSDEVKAKLDEIIEKAKARIGVA